MKAKDAEGRRRWALAGSELVAAVNRDDSVEAVIASIAAHALGLLDLDMCAVMLPNATQDRLLVVGSAGLSDAYIRRLHAEHPLTVDRTGTTVSSPSVVAFVTGRTMLVSDIELSPEMAEWRELALAEGYAALVAAPLTEGDQVTGVLVGYSRNRRDYSPQLVDLLDMFAVHAGATIQAARRRDELQHANASLHDANLELRRQSQSLEVLDRQHRRLMQVMANDVGVSGVATMLAELLDCSVTVEDPGGGTIATGSRGAYVAPPRGDERQSAPVKRAFAAAAASRAGAVPVQAARVGAVSFWIAPVTLHNEVVAVMWVGRRGLDLDEIALRGIERFALAIALEISKQRSAMQVRLRLSRDLVADLLSEFASSDRGALLERGATMGHDLRGENFLLAAREDPERLSITASESIYDVTETVVRSASPSALVGGISGDAVVLLPNSEGADPAGLASQIVAEFARRNPGRTASVIITEPLPDLGRISRAYRVTRGALDLMAHRRGVVMDLGDLGVAALLLSHGDSEALLQFANRLLADVDELGARRAAELFDTVSAWIDADRSTSHVAQRLHIHVNTVSYRLKALEERLGRSLRDPAFLVDLRLALIIRQISGHRDVAGDA